MKSVPGCSFPRAGGIDFCLGLAQSLPLLRLLNSTAFVFTIDVRTSIVRAAPSRRSEQLQVYMRRTGVTKRIEWRLHPVLLLPRYNQRSSLRSSFTVSAALRDRSEKSGQPTILFGPFGQWLELKPVLRCWRSKNTLRGAPPLSRSSDTRTHCAKPAPAQFD